MRKDAHLLLLARAADCVILSLDEQARRRFREALTGDRLARALVWVNPTQDIEDVRRWLRDGAKVTPERSLRGGAASAQRRQPSARR